MPSTIFFIMRFSCFFLSVHRGRFNVARRIPKFLLIFLNEFSKLTFRYFQARNANLFMSLCRKYHFLENSNNRILVKKFFLAKQKNTCLFIVDKEPKKNYLVQICDIDCQSNMEWPIYFIYSIRYIYYKICTYIYIYF